MHESISYQTPEGQPPTEPTTSRLRTVTGNRFARKCACGCGRGIPRDPTDCYAIDSGVAKRIL
jgi:hypothetical protein